MGCLTEDVSTPRPNAAGLRENEERLQLIARAANDPVWDWNIETGEMWWNEVHYRTFGYDSTTTASVERWAARIHPDDRERVLAHFRASVEGTAEAWSDEYRYLRADGSVGHIFDRAHIKRDAGGRPLRMVGAMVDVTDRRRLEEQLAHAEKMESVARLAGGVAHDFNNLLTVILSHAELMREPIRHLATATEDLNQIESATVRAAALTKQLLAFARRQVITPKVLELNDLLRGRERVLRRLVGDNIELELRLAPGRSLIRADPRQIEQVVINLAMNARDAMPRGGRLIIETELKNSEDVVLVVSDTGEGMSTEVMEHAFDPFFTTKPVGQGSGLGLATCYGIVKQSDGHIEVSSELGRGTTFRLYFPKGYEIDTQPVHAGSEVTPRGSETILLVEDEDSLRLVAGRTLRRQGYSILEAASGAEALRMAKETDRPIHLLLTDVVMPQMSGRDLADRLRALRPGIRILFTSGYTEDAISRHGILDPEVNFLPKPYVPALLTRRVRETLDGAAG